MEHAYSLYAIMKVYASETVLVFGGGRTDIEDFFARKCEIVIRWRLSIGRLVKVAMLVPACRGLSLTIMFALGEFVLRLLCRPVKGRNTALAPSMFGKI